MEELRNTRKRVLPGLIKLYWHCEVCDARKEWPENKASKYCSKKCRRRAGYLRLKYPEATIIAGDDYSGGSKMPEL